MSSAPTHILFEFAMGCAVFECVQAEEIGNKTEHVQAAIKDLNAFGRMLKLVSFRPFGNAQEALQACNAISEGVLDDHLRTLLSTALEPGSKKAKSAVLGVTERNLASAIVADLGIQCNTGDRTLELVRGIRLHADKLLKGLSEGDVRKAQLGLGHQYSRSKVQFNVNRSDNMIIQAIALIDTLDKDVNTFAMRVREWYGWHFPELVRIAPDNITYARIAKFIKHKENLKEEHIEELTDLLEGNEILAKNVLDASRTSMGQEVGEIDMMNIQTFADRVVQLADYRKSMHAYLREKMHLVAPNLSALLGEIIGARLISKAGSLTNLAKYPASTVQIIGAEKALFRALKTKGNTPKYGLIYHASAIARAAPKNKGRMSRFLANKISIASRIDCFTDAPTTRFGEVMAEQVEERLAFYETGKAPGKNSDAMRRALKAIEEQSGDLMAVDAEEADDDDEDDDDEDDDDDEEEEAASSKKSSKKSKDKGDKKKKKSSKGDKSEKKKKSKSGDKDLQRDIKKAAEKAAKKAAKEAKKEKKEKKDKKAKKASS
ncbi:Nucleolar protein 56 [Tilletia horrida]|nr:Nucleolar protein 56 [Tilletia horrida]